ncbi:MAG TPA: preprotein translocase subunit SecE [Planctomycetota bacterium]|nr:preprotein translocase subunit SecE [Planctomycetota bacterium]
METYKEGHGVVIRRVAYLALCVLVVWGGMTIYDLLVRFDAVRKARLVDYRIPVIQQYLDPAFVVCWLLVAAGCVWIYRLLNRERAAEYLIETDNEFRKVTWPTWTDARNSALVVLVFVLVLTGYIIVCDLTLTKILEFIL